MYKKLLGMLCAVSVAVSAAFIPAVSAASNDETKTWDFESDTADSFPTGWSLFEADKTGAVVAQDSNNKVLKVAGSSGAVGAKSSALTENPTAVEASFKFKYESGASDFQFRLSGTTANYLHFAVDAGKDASTKGLYVKYGTTGGNTLKVANDLVADTWYTVNAVVNNVTNTVRIEFNNNGTPVTGAYLRGSAASTCINSFSTVTDSATTYYVDDVTIKSLHHDTVELTGESTIEATAAKGAWSKSENGYALTNNNGIVEMAQAGSASNGQLTYTLYSDANDAAYYQGYKWTVEYSFLASNTAQKFKLRAITDSAAFSGGSAQIDTAVSTGAGKLAFPKVDALDFHGNRWYKIAFSFDPIGNRIITFINGKQYSEKFSLTAEAIKSISFIAEGATGADDAVQIKSVKLYEGLYSAPDTVSVTKKNENVAIDALNGTITMPAGLKNSNVVAYSGYDTIADENGIVTLTKGDIITYWTTKYTASAEYEKLADGDGTGTSDGLSWCAYKLTVDAGDDTVKSVTVKGKADADAEDNTASEDSYSGPAITGGTAIFSITATGTRSLASLKAVINGADVYTVEVE